jgi:hypothetical protein
VKLIVAEVVYELTAEELRNIRSGLWVSPKPEGTTIYPGSGVFVRTRSGTPRWIRREPSKRRPR